MFRGPIIKLFRKGESRSCLWGWGSLLGGSTLYGNLLWGTSGGLLGTGLLGDLLGDLLGGSTGLLGNSLCSNFSYRRKPG